MELADLMLFSQGIIAITDNMHEIYEFHLMQRRAEFMLYVHVKNMNYLFWKSNWLPQMFGGAIQ